MMEMLEYRTVRFSGDDIGHGVAALQHAGRGGWDLVSVTTFGNYQIAYLKRPLVSAALQEAT